MLQAMSDTHIVFVITSKMKVTIVNIENDFPGDLSIVAAGPKGWTLSGCLLR